MKINKKIVLGLLLLASMNYYSCNNNDLLSDNNSAGEPIKIDLKKALDDKIPELKLSDLASNVKYIKIETNDQCMLIHPYIEDVTEKAFYIGDTHRHLYKFDRKGNYIGEIGKTGKGPGEYLHITDVIVKQGNNIIYLLDNTQRKIIQYDLNGEFHSELRVPLSTGSFTLMNDIFVLWNPPWGFVDMDFCYFLTFMDFNGNILKHINRTLNNNDFRGGLLSYANFHLYNKNIFIKDTFYDTVFKINSDYDLESHFIISQGSLKIPRKISEDVWLREKYMNKYISQLSFLETKHFLSFDFFIGSYFKLIYDKQSKSFIHKSRGTLTDIGKIQNDIDNGPSFNEHFSKENKLFALITPSELIAHWPETLSCNVESIDKFSNPFVMIVKLK